MTSNYPPGVTGFEPAISGYDSTTEPDHREAYCENEDCSDFQILAEREVDLTKEFSHGVVYESWEWTCPTCKVTGEFNSEYEESDQD